MEMTFHGSKRMKHISGILFCALISLAALWSSEQNPTNTNDYIIHKKNGKIILAYKAFEDFLRSDRSWKSYRALLLDAYPAVQEVHNRQLQWGAIDSVQFLKDIKNYRREDFERYFTQYDDKTFNYLYDSLIERSHTILPPAIRKETDLCFFLPYGSCFVVPEDHKNTICISMLIDPKDVEKIMVHEYSHVLHLSRQPNEPLTLKREVVSEGMAVYLTNRIIKDIEVTNSVPFMSQSSFEWCLKNEQTIKDSIQLELNDTSERLFKRYISDGSFAEPPAGFVQKTAYFIGYRIIDRCVKKGMSLEEICSLESGMVIDKSEYFK
jgi:uncharacterized protein YjaZ